MPEFILHFWSGKGKEWSQESTLYKISDHWYHYKDGMFVFGYDNIDELNNAEDATREIRGLEDLSLIENDADANGGRRRSQ